jgi:hypothetical protein
VARLLLHNALRVDEACAADIADLGEDCGHQRAVSGASIVAISDIGETTVISSRFFMRCPDLGGLVGDNVFDESA